MNSRKLVNADGSILIQTIDRPTDRTAACLSIIRGPTDRSRHAARLTELPRADAPAPRVIRLSFDHIVKAFSFSTNFKPIKVGLFREYNPDTS